MSIIPSIFDASDARYTIVGGADRKNERDNPISIIVLNRGGKYYRAGMLSNLQELGYTSVISVELPGALYDVENLTLRFPQARFILLQDMVSVGEMINIAVCECESDYCLIMWNDMKITRASVPARLLERFSNERLICAAPLLQTSRLEALPVQMIPVIKRRMMEIVRAQCLKDASRTVYPVDFVGVYNRARFINSGGFDRKIADHYWQGLDFGVRSFLWGNEIRLASAFKLSYENEVPVERINFNEDYVRFFLKNMAVRKKRRKNGFLTSLPLSQFPGYFFKFKANIFHSCALFGEIRSWTARNADRFEIDARDLAASWEIAAE